MNEITIKKFSDQELDKSLSTLFETERRTTRLILLHLSEIEERKLYAKRGFDSLFSMLIKHYKLSETSARRRLKAMGLLKDVPSAQESIISGELNLSTLSMAQGQIKLEEKITGQKISPERKVEIVECIKNKTQAETEDELFKLLPSTASCPKNTIKRVSVDTTRLGLNFPDHVLNKLKRLSELWSHVDPGMDYVEIIDRCADDVLKRIDPARKARAKQSAHKIKRIETQSATAAATRPNNKATIRPTYYSVETKQIIWSRAKSCCEYVDPRTKRRCCSKFLLQVDHIVPLWAGGNNHLTNLQLLCAVHNRLKYQQETDPNFVTDNNVSYGYSRQPNAFA